MLLMAQLTCTNRSTTIPASNQGVETREGLAGAATALGGELGVRAIEIILMHRYPSAG